MNTFWRWIPGYIARALPVLCIVSLLVILGWYMSDMFGISMSLMWSIPVAGVLVSVRYARQRAVRYDRVIPWAEYIVLILGIIVTALVMMHWIGSYESSRQMPADIPWGQSVRISAVVTEYPDQRIDGQFVTLRPQAVSGQNHFLIRAKLSSREQVSYGDTVVLRGILQKPQSFTTNTGAVFDYPRYLSVRDITAELVHPTVLQIAHGQSSLLSYIYTLRSHADRALADSIPPDAYGLTAGVLLGSRAGLVPDMIQMFRNSGLSHIIVLSGFNITIVAIALGVLGQSLRIPRTALSIVTILCMTGFVIFSGMSPSIVRAGIIAVLLVIISTAHIQYRSWRALLYAVCIMCTLNPRILLFDVGFQLSVAATMGIIFLSPILQKYLRFVSQRFEMREIVATTLSAMIATAPITIFSMQSFASFGIIANILIVPIIPLFMLIGCIMMICYGLAPVFAEFCGVMLSWMVHYITIIGSYSAGFTTNNVWYNLAIGVVVGLILLGGLYLAHRVQSKWE